MKNMDDILDDLAVKWTELSSAQKTALAQTVAGVRQYNQLVSLLDNWFTDDADSMVANLGYTDVATGELQKQADIYAESWEAAGDHVQASLEAIYTDLIDDKFFIKLTNGFSSLLDSVDAFIDGIGGIKTILMGVATYFLSTMSTKIQPAWQNFKQNLEIAFTGRSQSAERQAQDIDKMLGNAISSAGFSEADEYSLIAAKELNKVKLRYQEIAKELTPIEQQRYQLQIDILQKHQEEIQDLIKSKENLQDNIKLKRQDVELAIKRLEKEKEIRKEAMANLSVKAKETKQLKEQAQSNYHDKANSYYNLETALKKSTIGQRGQEYQREVDATAVTGHATREEIRLANSALKAQEEYEQKTRILKQEFEQFLQDLSTQYSQSLTQETSVQSVNIKNTETDKIVTQLETLASSSGPNFLVNLRGELPEIQAELEEATYGLIDFKSEFSTLTLDANSSSPNQARKDLQILIDKIKNAKIEAKDFKAVMLKLGQGNQIKELEKAWDRVQQATENATKAQEAYDNAKKSNSDVTKAKQELELALQRKAKADQELAELERKIAEQRKSGAQRSEDFNPQHVASVSESLMKMVSGFGQVTMAVNSFRSVFSALNNDDLSFFEKTLTIMTSLSMGIPTLVTGIGNIGKSYQGLNAKLVEYIVAQKFSTEEERKSAEAKAYGEAISKKSLTTKLIHTIYTKLNTVATAEETAAVELDTKAELKNIAVKLLKSPVALAIAAAIALTTVVIYEAVKAANASKKAMEDASHAVEQLTTYYEEAKTAAEDLKSAISDWDEQVDALDDLIKGTDEYKEALEKANDQARELIETYGLYSKFHYDENGLIVFDEGALEEAQAKADAEAQAAQSALYGAKAQAAKTSNDYMLDKKFNNYADWAKLNLQTKNLADNYKGTNAFAWRETLKEVYETGGLEVLKSYVAGNSSIDLDDKSIEKLAFYFDDIIDAVNENTEVQRYNTQQQFKAEMSEKNSAWISEQAGEDAGLESVLTDAYAMAQTRAYETYAEENGKEIDSNYDLQSFLTTNGITSQHLGGVYSTDLNDKSLAKIYAEQVLDWTQEEAANAIYEGGTGKVKSLTSADGTKKIEDLSDQYMREQIQAAVLAKKFQESNEFVDENYQASVEKMIKATSELGIEGLGTSILTSLTQGEKVINVSDLIEPLSPEDAKKLQDMDADQLLAALGLDDTALGYYGIEEGADWAEGFIESLKNYDPVNWYLSSATTHGETAAALGEILEAYKKGEELTTEQENQLTELEEKYNNLAYMREQGGNAYLATLREIQELEENSKIENLQKALGELKLDLSEAINTGKSEEEINKIIDDILDTEHELKIAVKVDYESDVDQAFQIASQYDELAEYVKDGLEITAETAQQIIADGYGAMLKNAKATADGLIKLNQQEVTTFLQAKQEEIDGSKKSQIEQLKQKKTIYEAAIKDYEAEIKLLKGVTDSTSVEAKKQLLINTIKKAQQIENTAQTAETAVEYTTDATNSSIDNANVTGRGWVDTLNQIIDAAENATEAIGNIGNQSYVFNKASFTNTLGTIQFGAEQERKYANYLIKKLNNNGAGLPTTKENAENWLSNHGITYTQGMSEFDASNSFITSKATLEDYVNQAVSAVMESGKIEETDAYQTLVDQQIAYDESRIKDYKSRVGAIDASIAALESSGFNLTDLLGDLGEGLGKIAERYHEITREIQYQTKALEKLSTASDRAYGKTKLSYLDQEIGKRERILELQENLLKAAELNLIDDAAEVQKQFGNQATFDPISHELTNYTALYNAAKTDEQIEALEQYEETLDKIQEQAQEILETKNAIEDKRYEKLEYEIDLKVEIDDSDLKYLEHLLSRYEDDFFKRYESAMLTAQKAPIYQSQLRATKQMETDLIAQYNNGDISQSDYIEGLKKIRDLYYDNLEGLEEVDEAMKSYYSDTLTEAKEELEEYTDDFEHLNKVLEYYVDLADILGMSKDYEMMGEFVHAQSEIAKDEMDVATSYYNMLLGQRAEAQRKYDEALAFGDGDLAASLKEELDAVSEAVDEAQEEMLEKTKAWAEAMKAEIQNNLEKAAQTLESTFAGKYGTMDTLLDSFDKLNTQQEEFYTKTNQIYETNKLMRTANKALDEADNKAAKQKLKNFITETQNLQNKTKLSKYELEIQQAKYDLLLAEIALEEAQNAKSTVRLSRDSEGNFGYVYTADQDAIDDAQQNYEDKENALYNKSLEGQQNYTEKYLQAVKEMNEELTSLNESWLNGEIATREEYEQKKAAILDHYLDPEHGVLSTYSSLYNIAVRADTQATADYWGTEYGNMTGDTERWKEAVNNYLIEVDEQFDIWAGVSEECNERTGNAFSDTKEKVDELLQSSKDLKTYIEEDLIPQLNDEITKVGEVTAAYLANQEQIQLLIDEYDNYIEAINKAIAAESQLDRSTPDTTNTNFSSTGGGTVNKDKIPDRTGLNNGDDELPITNTLINKQELFIPYYTYGSGNTKHYKTAKAAADAALADGYSNATGINLISTIEGHMIIVGTVADVLAHPKQYDTYDTGGYTGAWGPEGKLAVLHQKEIVLNADDTENLLKSVSFVRELANLINMRAASASLFNLTSTGISSNDQTLEQNVTIHAEFPNAVNHSEIEEAFNNLVNRASQYANRK